MWHVKRREASPVLSTTRICISRSYLRAQTIISNSCLPLSNEWSWPIFKDVHSEKTTPEHARGGCISVSVYGQHIFKFSSYCQVTSLYDHGVRVHGISGFEVLHVAGPHSFFNTWRLIIYSKILLNSSRIFPLLPRIKYEINPLVHSDIVILYF